MENENKTTRASLDSAVILVSIIGLILLCVASALGIFDETRQLQIAFISGAICCLMCALLLMCFKYVTTGKKYAKGAKKRRKKYLPFMYGDRSIFKKKSL